VVPGPGPWTGQDVFGVVRVAPGAAMAESERRFRDWREPSSGTTSSAFGCAGTAGRSDKLSEKDLAKMAKRADAAYARQDYATAAPLTSNWPTLDGPALWSVLARCMRPDKE